MPTRAKGKSAPEPSNGEVGLEAAFRRIANLLALNLLKGESETDKVLTLTAVGYLPQEIAQLLGKQPNTVSVILYQAKQGGKRARRPR